jgi:hypothetical protein
MRKLVIGLMGLSILVLPVLLPPAHAQRGGQGPTPEELEKKRTNAEMDRKYKAALKGAGEETQAAAKKDPWANMRAPTSGSK